jgi:hypothetical protein
LTHPADQPAAGPPSAAAEPSPPAPRPPSAAAARFLFEQASALLEQQRGDLAELRGRAGLLLTAVSVSTALLGTVVLQRVNSWSALEWAALIFFVATSGASIAVLVPASDWIFGLSVKMLAEHYVEPNGEPCYLELAQIRESHFESNERKLKNKYRWFVAGCICLGIDVGVWLWAMYRLPPLNPGKETASVTTPKPDPGKPVRRGLTRPTPIPTPSTPGTPAQPPQSPSDPGPGRPDR